MPILDTYKYTRVIIDEDNLLNATPEDVLNGKTFVGEHKQMESGAIPILERHPDVVLTSGEEYSVPYGYNSSPYTVRAAILADQTKATATKADILEGRTAWVNGVLVTGEIPINKDTTVVLEGGQSYQIPYGYHTGNSIIQAKDVGSQTPGTAEAADVLEGRICWVNGVRIVGTMTNNLPELKILQAGDEYTIPIGYHSGTGVVRAETLEAQTPGNATSLDIIEEKVAWVNGEKITGEIPVIEDQDYEFGLNEEYHIPKGFHSGNGRILQHLETMEGFNVTPSFESQIVDTTDKYLTGDVIVTGIDAMNYQIFKQTSILTGTGSSDETDPTQEIVLGAVPVDNWHDQLTLNIYRIIITFKPRAAGEEAAPATFENSYTLFANGGIGIDMNNGPDQSAGKCIVINPSDNTKQDTVGVRFREADYAHEFYMSSTNFPNGYDVDFEVQEIAHFRQFGDDHDTDE